MPSRVPALVSDLVSSMESGYAHEYQAALARLMDGARAEGEEGLTAAVDALAPLLPGLGGDFAMTAVLAGACVEEGGSPLSLVEVLPQRAAEAMMLNAAIPDMWREATAGMPLPEPVPASARELVKGLTRRPWWRRMGRQTRQDMTRIAWSWFDVDQWLDALRTANTMRCIAPGSRA